MIPTLKSLNKSAIALLETIELKPLYEVIIREGLQLVNARYGTIYVANKGVLERVYSNVPPPLHVQIRKNGFTYKAYKSMKVKFIQVEKVEPVHHEIKDFKVRSIILIPLCYRNKCIGVISLDSFKDSLSEKEFVSMGLFGSMATLAINQAMLYQEAQEAVQQRDLLISLTAHEFRTPLTTINGYAQLLLRKIGASHSSIKEYITELYSETIRLINLTNGLLDMSRLKTGKMIFSFESVYIPDILDNAVARFKFGFPKHTLKYDIPKISRKILIGDYDKLLQVFTNLLDNAGKFTEADKPITLTLSETEKWAIVTVTDHGRGIIPDDLKRIFTGFYKGKNSDENQGMGLGLFISKSIIDAHQGKITVESEIGEGTTFQIKLPFKTNES